MKKAPLKIILGLQVIGLASLYADDFTWNVASGDWNNAANWTTINPGGPQDRFVNNGGTALITADTNLPIRDIKIGLGAGTSGFVVQTAGVATTGGGNWAFIGDSGGTGTYTISGGSLIGSGRFLIGDLGTGFLNVSGSPATSVSTGGEFWVGNGVGGSGTVTQTGGTVTSNDWLAIGRDQATGKYDLIDGALQHTGPNNTIIGSLSGHGTLNQTGGTFFEQNDLRLGENAGGDGAYNLSAGTATINGWVGLGWTGGGKGTITVSGTGELKVLNQHIEIGGAAGGTGDGTLNLNGGIVQTNTLTRVVAGTAQVNFNGGIFRAASSQGEFLPNFDAATTEVQAGGLKVDTNGFDLATAVGFDGVGGLTKLGSGKLTLNGICTYSGTTVIAGGTLALGPAGSLNPSSVVDVAAGAILDGSAVPGGLTIPSGQTLKGNGTTVGDTTVNGTVSPGSSLGMLTFSSNLTLNGNTVMEIDRTGAPASDRIIAGGPIDFGGNLSATLIGGSLQLGDSFDLFDAPSFFDVFATIDLPALPGDWYWSTTLPNSDPRNQLDNNGTIQVLPEPASAILGGLGVLGLLARRRRD